MSSLGPGTVVRRTDAALWSALGDDIVAMDIEHGTYFGLESVAGRIWTLIEEPASVAAICDRLVAEYDVSREQCQDEVLKFVDDLVQHRIVQVAGPIDQ